MFYSITVWVHKDVLVHEMQSLTKQHWAWTSMPLNHNRLLLLNRLGFCPSKWQPKGLWIISVPVNSLQWQVGVCEDNREGCNNPSSLVSNKTKNKSSLSSQWMFVHCFYSLQHCVTIVRFCIGLKLHLPSPWSSYLLPVIGFVAGRGCYCSNSTEMARCT